MAQDRKQLEALLLFIEKLSKEPGNEWFVEKLKGVVETKSSCLSFPNSEKKIEDIYELCIEKIIKEQASQFYCNFPIASIRQQLIGDFVRMEHFRRKDDFNDFCMALYQQIECIVNILCADVDLLQIAGRMMGYPAYTKNGKISERVDGSKYTIANLLFFRAPNNRCMHDS